jgi:hypothetical protein
VAVQSGNWRPLGPFNCIIRQNFVEIF